MKLGGSLTVRVELRAWYRTAKPRKVEWTHSGYCRENPLKFHAIYTRYGWFLVPKEFYGYRWTVQNISREIEARYPDIGKRGRSVAELQEVVDNWGLRADLSEKPALVKVSREDIRKMKEEQLYRMQLREDVAEESGEGGKEKRGRKKGKRKSVGGSITFTHAWNYYFSISLPKHGGLSRREGKKEVANEWNSLTTEEKEVYREAYAKLLSEGKDVYRGEIVTREEKLKRVPTKKR